MVTIIRFKGLKALPQFGTTPAQKKKFFTKAIVLAQAGDYWHMDMLDNPAEDTPFDQTENDTKLTIEIDHYDHLFAKGLTGKEAMVFYLELLRDNPQTIEEFDEIDDNGSGGIRRYMSVALKIVRPDSAVAE